MLAGKVLDAHTGQPLAGVVLSCLGAETVHYCRSDEGGCYGFIGIAEGCWQVWASKPPYSDYQRTYCYNGEVLNIYLQVERLEDEAVTA